MRDQQSSRSRQLLELGRIGMKELFREPVKQAVREALAEERAPAEDSEERTRRPDDTEQAESRNRSDADSGSRSLKPAILLGVLGIVAVAAVMKRQKLMEFMESEEFSDQSEERISSTVSNQRSTTHSDSTGTGASTDHAVGEGDVDRNISQGHEDYDVDPDNEEFSTTE